MDELELAVLKCRALYGALEAQVELAEAYFDGKEGFPENYEELARWAKMSAARLHPESLLWMGIFYHFWHGGHEQSVAAATSYYLAAAERGVTDANLGLGYMALWAHYTGTENLLKMAARNFRSGAIEGNANCMYALGLGIKVGLFVETSPGEGERFLREAAEEDVTSGSVDRLFNLILSK